MARGLQKIQSQQRAQDKKGKEKGSQLAARKAGIKMSCPECKCEIANYKTLVQHMQAKHPSATIPPEPSS
ncbi:uncharacterized protein MONOS_10821 [Monocercomonoides exilis]|uniref:uncharacterized protein n=1 Tax=Monocercomonoides exilis TaxID=2049356 RepID=UPI0035594943|nr:hypothetical protein MONOS_10821 [Monocercomonoides exilis]|eukprot:MONOS_10821.1-p1 / transcript=MONOS_10821.1 / gene=MONOS_10821 / organism=Monocercomonoides_exilis_PA203 / gene_product=unspecified product / transcript_product=unspecified product / location=Mono_scaffold00507:41563-41877(+) / protein_length=69 / sequence_SO=supercontig / SO=protein_coding / is_pseudo=false